MRKYISGYPSLQYWKGKGARVSQDSIIFTKVDSIFHEGAQSLPSKLFRFTFWRKREQTQIWKWDMRAEIQ